MWVCGSESFKIIEVNSAALRQYGYSHSEFLELSLADLCAKDIAPAVSEPGSKEERHRRKDGTLIDVEIFRRDIDLGGRRATLVISLDISERKRTEKTAAVFLQLGRRLNAVRTPRDAARTIADAAKVLFGWDACMVELCSADLQASRTILGIDTIDGCTAEFPSRGSVVGPVARAVMEQGARLVLRPAPGAFPPDALPFGNTARPSASMMNVPVRNEADVIGILSIQSYAPNAYMEDDLSTLQALADLCGGALERIRAEEEIGRLNLELRQRLEEQERLNAELEQRVQQRTAQLEAINRELEAFCYSVSHDLRAPLRSIRGFSEVLLERYAANLDEPGQEFLRRTCESCQGMDSLIEALLKLSRAGRSELRRQPVRLSALAEAIAGELHKIEPQRAVDWSIEPNLQAVGDETLLRVVLENLLRNAWKFTGQKPAARIEFGATREPTAAFFVRDDGAGFDMAYANKLFGVFQRLHSARDFPGTGVGLATVQRVINRHGGRVWATGAPNAGATFYFTLPPEGGL